MHIFTSVTANYIPKARVLASSVKKNHPEAHFVLVISDVIPKWLDIENEPFDTVIQIEEFNIPDFKAWLFKHSIVEVCTAVKGFAFQEIFRRFDAEKVIYLDPDIVVMSTLDPILQELDRYSILLTPHQTEPEVSLTAIIDNEICSLMHGVFNLGFVAVRKSEEGVRFIDWWAERLEYFCYDDIPGGLFTDQRWIDLAPCFFSDLHVLREPVYNVCTWNLTHRKITGSIETGVLVNGERLCFYHFSGFDSGAQRVMLEKYSEENPVLHAMRDWYIELCRAAGQDDYGRYPYAYGCFSNGAPISDAHRYLYRVRPDLQEAFRDPYDTENVHQSYFRWFQEQILHGIPLFDGSDSREAVMIQLMMVQAELKQIKSSITWKTNRFVARVIDPVIARLKKILP